MPKVRKSGRKTREPASDLKAWVVMSKANGELSVGYRVTLLDNGINVETAYGCIGIMQQDGWILWRPDFGAAVFFNMDIEKDIEALSEL